MLHIGELEEHRALLKRLFGVLLLDITQMFKNQFLTNCLSWKRGEICYLLQAAGNQDLSSSDPYPRPSYAELLRSRNRISLNNPRGVYHRLLIFLHCGCGVYSFIVNFVKSTLNLLYIYGSWTAKILVVFHYGNAYSSSFGKITKWQSSEIHSL